MDMPERTAAPLPVAAIQRRILRLRGERAILDVDLSAVYGVSTRRLNEQVKRNRSRFPTDFAFQLTPSEKREVVAICDHLPRLKFSRSLPWAFTEHGAIMAATVLNSRRAVEMSVFVVRAFVALRRVVAEHPELAAKLDRIERRLGDHDRQILALVRALRRLIAPAPVPRKRQIGFRPGA